LATTVWELRGRAFSFGEGRVENSLEYLVMDAADEAAAVAAIEAVIPSTWNDLWFLRTEAKEEGDGLWRGAVHYGIPATGTAVPGQGGVSPPPPPPPAPAATDALGPEWSFDTSGGTQHIVVSKATVDSIAASGVPPAAFNLIGLGKSGPEGCDIVVPKFEFSKTVKMEFITLNYMRTILDLVGKVNDATFLGVFAAGEVLYMGGPCSQRASDGVTLTHRFVASPNRTNTVVGSITIPATGGHEYVWFKYEDAEDAGQATKFPTAAYVEKVYDEGDFDELGI
jgi:hypothetical protein